MWLPGLAIVSLRELSSTPPFELDLAEFFDAVLRESVG